MRTAVVVAFERLPLRWLGCYGRSPSPTPHLDRFAADSVVFDRHFAENTDPDAANHAWWTGRRQFPLTHAEQRRQPAAVFDRLAGSGVEVVGVCESTSSSAPRPNGRGVDWRESSPSPGSRSLFRDAAAALTDTRGEAGHDRLLWVLSSELAVSEDGRTTSVEQRLRAIDESFGRFRDVVDRLRSTGSELLVVVTAAAGCVDSGFDTERGDNALPDEFRRLAESVTHAPLIVHSRGGDEGLRQSSFVQVIDLAPTLLEWFGVAAAESRFDGHRLLPLLTPELPNPGRESICFGDGRRAAAIRTRDFCLMAPWADCERQPAADAEGRVPPSVRMFVKPNDPWEVHDVVNQEPETAARLLEQLREAVAERL